ncbi:uncharacterized protein IL334_000817 [Kwoniella shivajii]|uniref:Phenazine biosynthesis protein n=1 Tax=Kwoniella shivajii TaxID=564305 RepID=A0ABZ1CTA6_9TREE|nr:hypothetical protein IL334_000817 [Kwoniella shivajii]
MLTSSLPFHLVNAFIVNDDLHSGNQASVVVFPDDQDERWKDERWLLNVAKDFNYSETAFLVPLSSPSQAETDTIGRWELRWFTVQEEVHLCGHATLATSKVLFSLYPSLDKVEFSTRYSGTLTAIKTEDDGIEITLPGMEDEYLSKAGTRGSEDEIERLSVALGLLDSGDILGISECLYSGDRSPIVQISDKVDIRDIQIDFKSLVTFSKSMVITQIDTLKSTEESNRLHIKSRVFGPGLGLDEDPVTGSAHADLCGYYLASPANKYLPEHLRDNPKIEVIALQCSQRGGELTLRWDEEIRKARIIGRAHQFAGGTLIGS